MAIAPQPAMTTETARARPRFARPPHGHVAAEQPPRTWTLAKIVGLVALTAFAAALATATVAGIALFALLNMR